MQTKTWTASTDARGVQVGYQYDAGGRLTGVTFPAVGNQPAGSIGYAYDAAGRRTSLTDPTGVTTWTYDAAGRITDLASPQGTLGYGYDAAGRQTSLTYPGNRTVTSAYDVAGQQTSLTDWQGKITTFAYDADGLRTAAERPNGVTSSYSYDGAGRLAMVEHDTTTAMLQRFVYQLDAAGNRTAVTVSGTAGGNGTESYQLDAINRLTNVTYPDGSAVAYEYDPNGNRTRQTTTAADGTTGELVYTYDGADQLTLGGATAYTYDLNGNLVGAGGDSFTYDWADRLVGVTTSSGSTVEYAYDGDGVRTARFASGATESLLWDRQGGLAQLVQDDGGSYLHDGGGLLAGYDPANQATYPLADGLGSIRGETAADGSLLGAADYSTFGEPRGATGTGTTTPFGFTSEQTDPTTGLVNLRARQYAPGLGRFLSRDTVLPNAPGSQGFNPYAYAANNPTTWTDPSGHAVGMGQFQPDAAVSLYDFGRDVTASGIAGAFRCIAAVFLWVSWVFNCYRYGYGACASPFAAPAEYTKVWRSARELERADVSWPSIPNRPRAHFRAKVASFTAGMSAANSNLDTSVGVGNFSAQPVQDLGYKQFAYALASSPPMPSPGADGGISSTSILRDIYHFMSMAFTKFLWSRVHDASNWPHLIWRSDGCNVIGSHGPVDMTDACHRHDFGYRNFKNIGKFTDQEKERVEAQFFVDMMEICMTRDDNSYACQRQASVTVYHTTLLGR